MHGFHTISIYFEMAILIPYLKFQLSSTYVIYVELSLKFIHIIFRTII